MEQAVWFYIGIIVALLGLGLLVSVVLMGTESSKQQLAQNASNSLALQCNNVCNSDIGTVLGIKTKLGSGTVVKSNGTAICTYYGKQKECRKCDCNIVDSNYEPFDFNLATEEAVKMFETHVYNCTFEKDLNVVVLRCKG